MAFPKRHKGDGEVARALRHLTGDRRVWLALPQAVFKFLKPPFRRGPPQALSLVRREPRARARCRLLPFAAPAGPSCAAPHRLTHSTLNVILGRSVGQAFW